MKKLEPCFRCNAQLTFIEEHKDVSFYYCNNCERRYSKKGDKQITDAWLSPISTVLYGIIFENDYIPDEKARENAEDLKHFSKDELGQIISDIEEELANPKQRLIDMLNLHGTEENTRDYLKRIVVLIKDIHQKKKNI